MRQQRKLLHTGRIGGKALPVRVAYSLCDGRVTYLSPPPTPEQIRAALDWRLLPS